MEDLKEVKNSVIVLLITSNLKYRDKKWTALMPAYIMEEEKFPSKDSLIDCNNWQELPKNKILQKKCRLVCCLKEEIITKIDKALEFAYKIPPEIMIRIKPCTPSNF